MRIMILTVNYIFLSILISACGSPVEIPQPPREEISDGKITINLSDERQTIHSFGASDSWTAKYVGNWSDITKKNKIADLLFSADTLPDGTPKGIGLSMWRFNIGAGSFEQGTESLITDEWRREESFQNADGSYDWTKHNGQRWFLQAAKERGVKYSLGFSVSAPVHMTKNGKAFSPGGNNFNIKSDKMDAFADFLAEVSSKMQFDYISPANEPQWAWTATNGYASQEGTPALNSELAVMARLLSKKIADKKSKTKVVVGEAGQLDFLFQRNADGRGDQINQFFSSASSNYIGNEANVSKIISYHSYFTSCPDDNLITVRQSANSKIKQVDPSLQVWQTEFGILGDICGKYNGYPRNTGIDYGLYIAKVIHNDLTVANVTGWHWWLAISPYDYSDALVYINAPDGSINVAGSKNDGQVFSSKQLWSFGNFSHFVRPGMIRVNATLSGNEDLVKAAGSTMVSAYKDPANKTVIIVIVNMRSEDIKLTLDGVNIDKKSLKAYTTSASKNLAKSVLVTNDIKIDKQSVTTLVGKYM